MGALAAEAPSPIKMGRQLVGPRRRLRKKGRDRSLPTPACGDVPCPKGSAAHGLTASSVAPPTKLAYGRRCRNSRFTSRARGSTSRAASPKSVQAYLNETDPEAGAACVIDYEKSTLSETMQVTAHTAGAAVDHATELFYRAPAST
jgi:hypothetical protein